MPTDSGLVYGYPISNSLVYQAWCQGALSLARYVNITGFPACGFWGVAREGESGRGCRPIWTLWQRLDLARALCEAQDMLEEVLEYPLGIQWIVEMQREYKTPAIAKYGFVIEPGVQAFTVIATGVLVDHTNDPAIVGPVGTTVTDVTEIKIFYPGTDLEIVPSKFTLIAGNFTAYIPRCRMVALENFDNPEIGWDYNDISVFEDEVDIVRVYNDNSTEGVLVTNHVCTAACPTGCTEATQASCIYVRTPRIGALEIFPAVYASGNWSRTSCHKPWRFMRLNYKAGMELTRHAESAIMRLAHSLMPVEPCGCNPVKAMWARDRFIPDVLTGERLNNKFGSSDGAWASYMFARDMKLVRSGLAL